MLENDKSKNMLNIKMLKLTFRNLELELKNVAASFSIGATVA
jgi:hypothetical protein